jgi:hypothetical protein
MGKTPVRATHATFVLGVMLWTAAASGLASAKQTDCNVLLVEGRHVEVSTAAKEALVLARRTGILELRVVLQIPTGARGVLPPYLQLQVERDRLASLLRNAGGHVQPVPMEAPGVTRAALHVIGPYRTLLPLMLRHRWVAKLLTDGDASEPWVPTPATADHEARKVAAQESARTQALRPTHLDLENRIVGAIREGYRPVPEAVDVQLIATVGPSSLFLATLPVDRGSERRSIAFLLRVDHHGAAHDAQVERVLAPDELTALLRSAPEAAP